MQQDLIMEKKPVIRTNQPPAKGLAVESKKNQDVPGNKPWSKGLRSSYGANAKPAPPRNRNFGYDKRPRPRAGQVGGKADARLEEYEQPEHGSVMKLGIKKQSLNHLLNFHYTPRTSNCPGAYGRQYHQKGKIHYPKYNKEHYLQANCQFIVREGEDYSSCLNNPDALVDWTYIEQILVKSEEPPNCPICLEKPLAGRITRCGHIYCYPCILHYLALSDKPWRKCPICYEAVHPKDLKSVCWIPIGSFRINDTITLQLMRRPRFSMQSWPVDHDPISDKNCIPNVNDGLYVTQYCKLLRANSEQVLDIIEMDIGELERAWKSEENTPEACFIQQAVELLKIYRNEKLVIRDKIGSSKLSDFESDFEKLCCSDEMSEQVDVIGDVVDPICEMDFPENSSVVDCSLDLTESASCSNFGDSANKDFYFYQASDGQHIYLAGLCARVLEHSYGGSLALCPKTITATVEAREVLTVTEDLRKRLRYLQHLPVTCQIELVELNLRPPTVKIESLQFYHDQLEARRKSRLRKSREENRRDLQITREQERKQGLPISDRGGGSSFPQRTVRIDSESDFPLCGSPPSTLGGNSNSSPSLNINGNSFAEATGGYDNQMSSCSTSSSQGPSFATMLTMARSPGQPSYMRATRTTNNEPENRSSKYPDSNHSGDSNPEHDENYVPAPSYTQSFRDAISQAMEKSCQVANVSSKENTSKKNKKKKKQILFATGMNFQV